MAQAVGVHKIHTSILSTVPKYAKSDPRKRWWCSRPDCCTSVTADYDLTRHYKERHREFVDSHEKVLSTEKETWVHARYLESRHASEEEKYSASQIVLGGMISPIESLIENEDEGTGQQFELPYTPSAAFVTLQLPRPLPATPSSPLVTFRNPRKLSNTHHSSFVTLRFPHQPDRLAAVCAIHRLGSVTELDVAAADLLFDELISHSTNILTDIGQSLNGLLEVQRGKTIPGHTFYTMFDLITRSMTTVTKLQKLALPLRLEQSEHEKTESEDGVESQQEDNDHIMINDDEGDWNGEDHSEVEIVAEYVDLTIDLSHAEDKILSTAPSFEEWTSAQMLLHAAELRYHAWDIGEDGLKAKAKACAREAEEWEIEGQRRRTLEEAGEREAWDWGCTHFHVERDWDWRLQQATEEAERPGLPFLAKNEYDP